MNIKIDKDAISFKRNLFFTDVVIDGESFFVLEYNIENDKWELAGLKTKGFLKDLYIYLKVKNQIKKNIPEVISVLRRNKKFIAGVYNPLNYNFYEGENKYGSSTKSFAYENEELKFNIEAYEEGKFFCYSDDENEKINLTISGEYLGEEINNLKNFEKLHPKYRLKVLLNEYKEKTV